MTQYKIHCIEGKHYIHRIVDGCIAGWFAGYDFMGTACWGSLDIDYSFGACTRNEAEQIAADLASADM